MDLSGALWRKSSFSGDQGQDGSSGCIEVALLPDGGVAIRDSTDRSLAPHVYTAREWDAFVAGVRWRVRPAVAVRPPDRWAVNVDAMTQPCRLPDVPERP